jgi:hypothetical protein
MAVGLTILGGCTPFASAGNLEDAGLADADAVAGADAGGDRFCAGSKHSFCADFDDPTPDGGLLTGGWDQVQKARGGLVEISTEHPRSGARSLKATMPRETTTGAIAALARIFPGWRHVVLDFDLYIEKPSWQVDDVNIGIATVGFYSTSGQQEMDLAFAQQYSAYALGTAGQDQNRPALPSDVWIHAHFDVQAGGSATARVGTLDYAVTGSSVSPGGSPSTYVFMGLSGFNAPSPDVVAYFDNVVVDVL